MERRNKSKTEKAKNQKKKKVCKTKQIETKQNNKTKEYTDRSQQAVNDGAVVSRQQRGTRDRGKNVKPKDRRGDESSRRKREREQPNDESTVALMMIGTRHRSGVSTIDREREKRARAPSGPVMVVFFVTTVTLVAALPRCHQGSGRTPPEGISFHRRLRIGRRGRSCI